MKIEKNFNVAQKLSFAAERFPSKKALIFTKRHGNQLLYESITFSELESRANRLACALSKLSLSKGDRVLVMIPISIDLYLVLSTLFKLGAVPVFIDPWVGRKQIERCCELTQPKAFISTPTAHLLKMFSSAMRRIPIQIKTSEASILRAHSLRHLLAISDSEYESARVQRDDPALLTFTTGSTGEPKGAVRTHGFLMSQHEILTAHLGLTPNDIDMPTLPIFILNNLANGITSIFLAMNPRTPALINPELAVRQIREFKITTSTGSPAFYAAIARHCVANKIQLDNVRSIFTGGAPVRPELVKELTQVFPKSEIAVVYGSTEAEPISMISAQEILSETAALTREGKGTCVGRPVNEIEVRIIKISDAPIDFSSWDSLQQPSETIGEIVVTGHHVNKSYYNNPQAVRENKFTDSAGAIWHRTGDAGYLDTKGRLWLVGRVKHRVVRSGKDYHSLQIEPVIDALPFVERSALIGLADAQLGQKLALVIEPRKKFFWHKMVLKNQWKQEIQSLCQSRNFPIDHIYFCPQIPLDPRHQAKIEYNKLRQRYSK